MNWHPSDHPNCKSRWSKLLLGGVVLASISNALGAIAYLHSSPEALSLHYPYVIVSIGGLLMAMFLVYRAIFENDR